MTKKHAHLGLCIAISLAAVPFYRSPLAYGSSSYLLRGLFCNTEAQIEKTVAAIRPNATLEAAIAVANFDKIECVLARDIAFAVVDPMVIGKIDHHGLQYLKYEARLVGIMVGTNLRPVDPPVTTFFVRTELLAGSARRSPS